MIPAEVHGNPVRLYAVIDPPIFPRDYPGDGGLERTSAFLISVSAEGDCAEERFCVSCLGETGRIMAGEIFYSLDSAKEYPSSEFDSGVLEWVARDAAKG